MNRYRATVIVKKIYIAEEQVTFDIAVCDVNTASRDACQLAERHTSIGNSDAELNETEVGIVSIELVEGENCENLQTPRCDKTSDMFENQK